MRGDGGGRGDDTLTRHQARYCVNADLESVPLLAGRWSLPDWRPGPGETTGKPGQRGHGHQAGDGGRGDDGALRRSPSASV